MPMTKAPRRLTRRQELREDTLVTFTTRAQDFFENRRSLVYGILAGIALLIAAIFILRWMGQQKADEAAGLMGQIVGVYEDGNYREALDGTLEAEGLLHIADNFGSTPDGNLARFYAGDALYRLGEKDKALDYFGKYDGGATFIGASALAGEAAILEDTGEFNKAAALYERAAAKFENELSSPGHLASAARCYASAGNFSKASDLLESIADDYPGTAAAANVPVLLAEFAARNK